MTTALPDLLSEPDAARSEAHGGRCAGGSRLLDARDTGNPRARQHAVERAVHQDRRPEAAGAVG
jgi:hypothetical protein